MRIVIIIWIEWAHVFYPLSFGVVTGVVHVQDSVWADGLVCSVQCTVCSVQCALCLVQKMSVLFCFLFGKDDTTRDNEAGGQAGRQAGTDKSDQTTSIDERQACQTAGFPMFPACSRSISRPLRGQGRAWVDRGAHLSSLTRGTRPWTTLDDFGQD